MFDKPIASNAGLTLGQNSGTGGSIALNGATSGSASLTVATDGASVTLNKVLIVSGAVATPASAAAACTAGTFAFDATFFYACVATNTWVRGALATW